LPCLAWIACAILVWQPIASPAAPLGRGSLRDRIDRAAIDGHQGAGELEPFEQERDGGDLVRLAGDRLLAKDQPLAVGPSRDQMEGLAALGAGMAAARGLAVDGDELRLVGAQSISPAALAAPFPKEPTLQASAG
jgi:hypothetical protein